MKTALIAAIAAAAVLAACTSKETKVVDAPAPAPAPTVVVTPPTVAVAPTQGQVIVTYMQGTTTATMAQTAASYCAQHYGSTSARFVGDDYAGHATYACVM
jgi:putative hemolysin